MLKRLATSAFSPPAAPAEVTVRLLVVPFVGVLAACRPAGPGTEDPVVPDPVIATITADGGEVVVPGTADSRLTLQFAAGAVTEPFELTVTPEATGDGELFRAAILPRAMLLDGPMHVRLELGSANAPTDLSALRFGGNYVSATIDPVADRLDADVMAWGSQVTGDSPFGRMEDPPDPDTDGTDLSTQRQLEVIDRIAEARDLLTRLETEPHVTTALALKDLMHDLATNPVDPESDPLVTDFIDEATDRACNGALDAADNALFGPGILTVDDLQSFVRPMLAWEAVRTDLDRSMCGASPIAQDVESLSTDASTAYGSWAADAVPGTADWDGLLGAMDDAVTLGREANALGIPGIDTILADKVIRPLFDQLRRPAWDFCHETGDERPLGDLLDRFRTLGDAADGLDDALVTDIRTCSMAMTYDSRDANDNVVAAGTVESQPPPIIPNLQFHVAVNGTGSVALGGHLRALMCPGGGFDDEELVVYADDVEFVRLEPIGGEYLPLSPIRMADLYATAGLTAGQVHQLRLRLHREGTGCSGAYGEGSHDAVVLLLDVDWGPIWGTYVGTYDYYDTTGAYTHSGGGQIVIGQDIGSGWPIVTESYEGNPDYTRIVEANGGWTPPTFVCAGGAYGEVSIDVNDAATLHFWNYDYYLERSFVGVRQ
jgi:hypothetical protein